MAARNPARASVRLPGGPNLPVGKRSQGPGQGAGMEDAGQGGGQTRGRPARLREVHTLCRKEADA